MGSVLWISWPPYQDIEQHMYIGWLVVCLIRVQSYGYFDQNYIILNNSSKVKSNALKVFLIRILLVFTIITKYWLAPWGSIQEPNWTLFRVQSYEYFISILNNIPWVNSNVLELCLIWGKYYKDFYLLNNKFWNLPRVKSKILVLSGFHPVTIFAAYW